MQGRTTSNTLKIYILTTLTKQNRRGEAYDVASAMSSDKKGGRTYIKDNQPKQNTGTVEIMF